LKLTKWRVHTPRQDEGTVAEIGGEDGALSRLALLTVVTV
jgi:hypothetical protein